jgi:hypothetical protein
MPGPPTTNLAKSAKLVKQGHTTTGKFGDGYAMKGKVPTPREVSPKG